MKRPRFLLGIVLGLLMTASIVMGESVTCVTTTMPRAIIGVTQAHLDQGIALIVDNDWVAFRALEARGVVRMLEPGTELLVSEGRTRSKYDLVSVRRQGSPDTLYGYRYSFECLKKPKAKKAR
jgi:hypothetical protein